MRDQFYQRLSRQFPVPLTVLSGARKESPCAGRRAGVGSTVMQGLLRGSGMDAQEGVAAPSRRSILKGGLIAAAGALGWGASAATRDGMAKPSTATELSLQGARLRSMSGELVGSGDRAIGSFSATHLALPPAGSDTPGTELQTFSLEDGSIFGLGPPPARGDGPAVYAVLGGT